MNHDINKAFEAYMEHWQQLTVERKNREFFTDLKPVAIGWKVADAAEYQRLYAELREHSDKVIETWMNGRWIAKLHLRDGTLSYGVTIIKLMQRRPKSDDALELDHVDFYNPADSDIEAVVQTEPELQWTWEENDAIDDYRWISVWFAGSEAKIRNSTVLNLVIDELEQINNDITR